MAVIWSRHCPRFDEAWPGCVRVSIPATFHRPLNPQQPPRGMRCLSAVTEFVFMSRVLLFLAQLTSFAHVPRASNGHGALVFGLVGCVVVACRGSVVPRPDSPSRLACASTGRFAVLSGADTVRIEELEVSSTEFSASVRVHAQDALLRFRGDLDTNAVVQRIDVAVWHAVQDTVSDPAQQARVTIDDEMAVSVVLAPSRAAQLQREPIAQGAMPFMANILLFVDLLHRRTRGKPGSVTEVPVFWLFAGGQRDSARVRTVEGDSIAVRVPGAEYRLARTSQGSLMGGTATVQNGSDSERLRIVRLDCR